MLNAFTLPYGAPMKSIKPLQNKRQEHREFLNKLYGLARSSYDLTRKYFLFGRETLIKELLQEPWESLIEVGPGTGWNLRKLHKGRPSSLYGGLEASDKMLEFAKERCPFAVFRQGFAEDTPYQDLLGEAPDRILFSYCLTMVQDPHLALEKAVEQLAPGGQVVVVDFADFQGAPFVLRGGLRRWLKAFHVTPLDTSLFEPFTQDITFGPWHYFVIARIHKPA